MKRTKRATKVVSERNFVASAVLLLSLVVSFSGCAHYQWGVSQDLPFQSVFLDVVENQSFAPQVQVSLTRALKKSLLGSGSVRLVSSEVGADVTLSVVISEFTRQVSATDSSDTARGQSFVVNLKTRVTLSDNRSDRLWLKDREFVASNRVLVNQSYPQSEYLSIPVLTEDLGHKISRFVVSIW